MHEFADTFSLISTIYHRERWYGGYTKTHENNPSSKITLANREGYITIAEIVTDTTDDIV